MGNRRILRDQISDIPVAYNNLHFFLEKDGIVVSVFCQRIGRNGHKKVAAIPINALEARRRQLEEGLHGVGLTNTQICDIVNRVLNEALTL